MTNNTTASFDHWNWDSHLLYPAVSIWGLFFLISVAGNICVCVISYRRLHILGIKTYYFTSLALADLIFTLSTLFYVLNIVLPENIYSSFTCKLFYYTINTSHGTSVFNLLLLTYNRYNAVISPLKEFSNRTKKKGVRRKLLMTWSAALIPYIPHLFLYYVSDNPGENGTHCSQGKPTFYISFYYGLLVVLMYLTPLIVIVVSYCRICLRLSFATQRSSDCVAYRYRQKAIKLLIIIAGLFFILWTPFNTMLVIIFVLQIKFEYCPLAWALSTLLILVNASINPWLYLLVGRKSKQRGSLTTPRAKLRLQVM